MADALAAATQDREKHQRQDGTTSSSKSKSSSSSSSSKKEEKVRQLSEVLDEELRVYEQPKAGETQEEDPTELEKQRLLAQIKR